VKSFGPIGKNFLQEVNKMRSSKAKVFSTFVGNDKGKLLDF